MTDFRGLVITNREDKLDRLASRTLPGVNSGENGGTVQYHYTADASSVGLLDQVTRIGDAPRTAYCAYDDRRRLVKKDVPEGVLAYGYTANNSLASLQGYRRSVTKPATL